MRSEDDREQRQPKRKRYDGADSNIEQRTKQRTSLSSDDDRTLGRRSARRRRSSSIGENYRTTDSYRRERQRDLRSRSPDQDDTRHRRRRSLSSEPESRRRSDRKDKSRESDGRSGRRRTADDSDGERTYRRAKRRGSNSLERSRDRDRRRDRSRDRDPDRERRQPYRSRSPHHGRQEQAPRRRYRGTSRSASPPRRSRKALPSQNDSFNALTRTGLTPPPNDKPIVKEKPNYNTTGLLARETNLVAGTDIVLKYNEPPEARKPPASRAWRMFVFKGSDVLETLELGGKSVWLLGRENKVVDVLTAHPSCSGQHAVVQFRHTTKTGKNGEPRPGVRPYLLDLESANGTVLNGQRVESRRYVELRSGDLVKFGSSEREYVIMLPPKEN
ncbi:MAG: hypothetical protein Q9165_001294 [Trypethelium subeluteriae]